LDDTLGKITVVKISFILALILGSGFAVSAQAASPTLELNDYRTGHGLSMVREDSRLMAIAQRQADGMAAANTMSHAVIGNFGSRIAGAGLNGAGENLAYGNSDFPATLKQWRNSKGHNANLLMPGARRWGYARSCSTRCYWVMVIGR